MKAFELYSKAIRLCSDNNAIIYCNRSDCRMKMHDYDGALADSRTAIVIDDKLKDGYDCQIRCFLAIGNTAEAEKAVEQLMKIDPNNNTPYAEQCKQQRSSVENAMQCFEQNDFKSAGM